jgi:glycosyl transferase, family 25
MLDALLINLDRDPDRHAHMAAEFARVGLSYARIPAVLGLAMPAWAEPYFLTPGGKIASNLKAGEVGCYASHLVAARYLLDSGRTSALICEDDLTLPADLAPLLEAALENLPRDWDILRLSNPPKAAYRALAPLPGGRDLVVYSRVPNNTGCHLLSRRGAEKLLAPGLRTLQIDEHLRRPWRLGMETYGIAPAPLISNIFDSTIDAMEDRGLGREGWIAKMRRRDPGTPADWARQAMAPPWRFWHDFRLFADASGLRPEKMRPQADKP